MKFEALYNLIMENNNSYMNFIQDPKTDILYSPILPKPYLRIFEDSHSTLSTFEDIYYSEKEVDYRLQTQDLITNKQKIKQLVNSWIKITGLYGSHFLSTKNKYYMIINAVDIDSIKNSKKLKPDQKQEILENVEIFYLEPKLNLDPETEKDWGAIIHEL